MQDLTLNVGKAVFSVRCGIILRYKGKVVVEVSKVGENSVIPGGRIKIRESSKNAILREVREETGFVLNEKDLRFITVLENFFELNGKECHELFFLYESNLEKWVAERFLEETTNKDNKNNFFKLYEKDALATLNLLPTTLFDYI